LLKVEVEHRESVRKFSEGVRGTKLRRDITFGSVAQDKGGKAENSSRGRESTT
jgi:hypothetical protein